MWLRVDARSLARLDLDRLSADDLPSHSRCEEGLGAKITRATWNSGPVLAALILFVRHGKEFQERLLYMHLNPVRKGLVAKPEEWRWSSCKNFALEKAVVAACPIQIDYVMLPEEYRA